MSGKGRFGRLVHGGYEQSGEDYVVAHTVEIVGGCDIRDHLVREALRQLE